MPEETKNDDQSVTDALSGGEGGGPGIVGKILKLILPVGLVVVFGVGGFFASSLGGGPVAADADTSDTTDQTPEKEDQTPVDDSGEREHHDLKPIVVNLNEPQVTRYLRAGFSLAIASGDFADAEAIVTKKSHDLRDWLIGYLSNLSIEDIRGAKNINRVRREVQDLLNDRLWPGKRPRILSVSLSEWIVQ
jgi:flagellar basal body-associated protein FliL